MATTYTIDGTTAALAPYAVTYQNVEVGVDHNGAPILSAFKEVTLQFDGASITYAREWLNTQDGAPHSFDILGDTSLGFVTLSNIYVRVESYPTIESVLAGPFSIKLLRVT
jgi:hypothetical protein